MEGRPPRTTAAEQNRHSLRGWGGWTEVTASPWPKRVRPWRQTRPRPTQMPPKLPRTSTPRTRCRPPSLPTPMRGAAGHTAPRLACRGGWRMLQRRWKAGSLAAATVWTRFAGGAAAGVARGGWWLLHALAAYRRERAAAWSRPLAGPPTVADGRRRPERCRRLEGGRLAGFPWVEQAVRGAGLRLGVGHQWWEGRRGREKGRRRCPTVLIIAGTGAKEAPARWWSVVPIVATRWR